MKSRCKTCISESGDLEHVLLAVMHEQAGLGQRVAERENSSLGVHHITDRKSHPRETRSRSLG